jgi:hypothetical protein
LGLKSPTAAPMLPEITAFPAAESAQYHGRPAHCRTHNPILPTR